MRQGAGWSPAGQVPEFLLDQHGTCVLGAIAGSSKGVAPQVNVLHYQANRGADAAFLVEILRRVLFDWTRYKHNSQTPLAVLNMSWSTPLDPDSAPRKEMKAILEQLMWEGVVCITAAGNQGFVSKALFWNLQNFTDEIGRAHV